MNDLSHKNEVRIKPCHVMCKFEVNFCGVWNTIE